jgi:NADH dehydrogenase
LGKCDDQAANQLWKGQSILKDIMENKPTRIVILGGGFGGLYTALHLEKTLARDPNVEITLVNRENFFLFTPMLHEVAASDLTSRTS